MLTSTRNVNGQWVCEDTLKGHSGWVRDVSFAAHTGADTRYLASCSEVYPSIVWKKANCLFAGQVCAYLEKASVPENMDSVSTDARKATLHSLEAGLVLPRRYPCNITQRRSDYPLERDTVGHLGPV